MESVPVMTGAWFFHDGTRVRLARVGDEELLRPLLSKDEALHASSLANSVVRARFVVSRAMRRQILSECIGCPPGDLRFAVSEHGKPYAENAGAWEFNSSHAGDLIAVAVAPRPVGIDIEVLRPVGDPAGIAGRYFHADEAGAWRSLPDGEREEAFFVLWSAREAAMKCSGLGLARGLSITRVEPLILSAAEAGARVGDAEIELRRFDAPPGYVMVLAAG